MSGPAGESPTAEDVAKHASPKSFGPERPCGTMAHDIDAGDVRDTRTRKWWLQVASERSRDTGRDDGLQSRVVARVYHRTGGLWDAV